jgi:predicted amidophosphoribosyltransferase
MKHDGMSLREVWFPYWFPVLLFAILPAFRLRSILRNRHRHRAGFCQHCGYDLRATPNRCPECGMMSSPGEPSPQSSGLE